jgi:hypothetical protein
MPYALILCGLFGAPHRQEPQHPRTWFWAAPCTCGHDKLTRHGTAQWLCRIAQLVVDVDNVGVRKVSRQEAEPRNCPLRPVPGVVHEYRDIGRAGNTFSCSLRPAEIQDSLHVILISSAKCIHAFDIILAEDPLIGGCIFRNIVERIFGETLVIHSER